MDGPYYLSVPLVDFVSPGSNPSSLAFADTDPGASLVAGTLTIGLPAPGRVPPIARRVLVCVTVFRVDEEGGGTRRRQKGQDKNCTQHIDTQQPQKKRWPPAREDHRRLAHSYIYSKMRQGRPAAGAGAQ